MLTDPKINTQIFKYKGPLKFIHTSSINIFFLTFLLSSFSPLLYYMLSQIEIRESEKHRHREREREFYNHRTGSSRKPRHEQSSSHTKLYPIIYRRWRPTNNATLLHPWRKKSLVLKLAFNWWLAYHSRPSNNHILKPPSQTRHKHQTLLHETTFVHCLRSYRNHHRPC